MSYTPRHHYTLEELNRDAIADLRNDYRCALADADGARGPILSEEWAQGLRNYAAKCKATIVAMGGTVEEMS